MTITACIVRTVLLAGLVLCAVSCQAPITAADPTPPPPDGLGEQLPPRFLVADGKFEVDPPEAGARGKAANRFVIALLTRARAKLFNLTGHHARMLQYTGRFTKEEWIPQKKKTIRQVATFKFRLYPFSVRFTWIEGPNEGRAVAYVARKKYKGRMWVFGIPILGSISLDPNDRKVYETSRHPITSAGLHSATMRLLDQFSAVYDLEMWDGVHKGKKYGVTYHGVVKDPLEGRKKYKITRVSPTEWWPVTDDKGNPVLDEKGKPRKVRFYSRSTTVYIDTEYLVPTRIEVVDFDGRPIEQYNYTQLKWGAEFKKPDDDDFWEE